MGEPPFANQKDLRSLVRRTCGHRKSGRVIMDQVNAGQMNRCLGNMDQVNAGRVNAGQVDDDQLNSGRYFSQYRNSSTRFMMATKDAEMMFQSPLVKLKTRKFTERGVSTTAIKGTHL